MSSVLDKSLDEILADRPKKVVQKKKAPAAKSKVSKATTAPKKTGAKKAAPAKPAAPVLDASFADKVVVHNLPTDIKYDAVKDFFSSQIGGVKRVELQYNEKGQSRGIATVIFKSAASASKAVEKYNGAPIDGGKSKLRLELIIDPTKKPLISRIVANAPAKKEQPKKANVKKEQPKKADQKKKKENKPKNKRPVKKTIEQLDQEMADYFEKK